MMDFMYRYTAEVLQDAAVGGPPRCPAVLAPGRLR
jgi:hypothetical protein